MVGGVWGRDGSMADVFAVALSHNGGEEGATETTVNGICRSFCGH